MILGGFSVKKAIIVLTVILCILTFSACESSPGMNGGPEVNGYVKIARIVKGDGCEAECNEYLRPAPEAHKIKAWLSGLELQKTEYPREFDDVSYDLEFKQMSVLDDITELSVYTCRGEQFLWFNKELYSVENPCALPSELTVESVMLPDYFDSVDISYTIKHDTVSVSAGAEKVEEINAWLQSLRLRPRDPDTCGNVVFNEAYRFEFKDPLGNDFYVSYKNSDEYGENGYVLVFNKKWYYVLNPCSPPV